MHIQVLKENFAKTIQLAVKFTSTKAQLPILSCLVIDARDEGIFVTATSLEVGIRLQMAGKILEKGKVVVPAKILSDLAQSLPLGGITLQVNESGELIVSTQRTRARLQTMKQEDFPPFPELPPLVGQLDVEQFGEMYGRVGYAVSGDETRPVLTGFLWQWKQGNVVATDGYRLSLIMKQSLLEVQGMEMDSVVIPGKSMVQLLQVLEELKENSVRFGFAEQGQQLMFAGTLVTGVIRVLPGNFPKYESILPTDSLVELKIDREQFLSAVRSAAIFARDSANIVRLKIADGTVEVSANTAQVGDNLVGVEYETVKEGEGTIAFNSKYLIDFLTHSTAATVGFGMTDPLKAALFYEAGLDEYKHVIMPVRVRE